MNQSENREYDDSYPTCERTYCTLRIFSDDLSPTEITAILGIQPTETFKKGDHHGRDNLQRKTNGWFFTTNESTASRDFRRHLDVILDALDGKADAVESLTSKACKIDITSYYNSVGQGGPWLMPYQMLKLGALGISIWWDVYFASDNENA
jgi:hypothetical protein